MFLERNDLNVDVTFLVFVKCSLLFFVKTKQVVRTIYIGSRNSKSKKRGITIMFFLVSIRVEIGMNRSFSMIHIAIKIRLTQTQDNIKSKKLQSILN